MKNRLINKIVAFFVFMSILLGVSRAQTTFYTENFESGSTPAGWTLSSGSDFGGNIWVVNNVYTGLLFTATPDQPTGITNSPNSFYMHINNLPFAGIDDQTVYDADDASEAVATSVSISTLGRTDVGFRYWTLCEGTPGADFGQIFYSIDNGATFLPVPTAIYHSLGQAWLQVCVSPQAVSNAFDNKASIIFQFKWSNDGSGNSAGDPAWALDEFELIENYSNCTPPVTGGTVHVSRINMCAPDTFTVGWDSPLALNAGNIVQVEISDASGNFPGTILTPNIPSTLQVGFAFPINIPSSLTPSTNYKIRVNTTNPVQNLTEFPTAITIANCGALSMTQPAIDFQTTYCLPGSNFTVNFSASGYTDNNQFFRIEMSDASGSFASPTTIGSLQGTTGGTITCFIPNSTPAGTGYRFRIVSTNPAVIGADNGFNVSINTSVIPSVTIATTTSFPICTGDPVTFTATPTNGGTTPTYQWFVNGTLQAGQTTATFTSSTLTNGATVSCTMTSNAVCASPLTANSNVINVSVSTGATPSVSISTLTLFPICAGTSVTFTANPTNGGTAPTYTWFRNGLNIGTGVSITISTLANNDNISCQMVSNSSCGGGTATSNVIVALVNTSVVPTVSISANPSGFICTGTPVTFSANITNGGTNPTYNWMVNGTNVGNGPTFTSSTLTNGQNVTLTITSNEPCAVPSTATSSQITANVGSASVVGLSMTANPNSTICQGGSITFTATPSNGGAAPIYQWFVNNVLVAGQTASTFTSTTLNNGDIVKCTVTSNSACITGTPDASSQLPVSVSNQVPVAVALTVSPSGPVCNGTPVTLTATPQKPGITPVYRWFLNGIQQVNSNTTFNYTPTNGDQITVELTSSLGCASGNPATSNLVIIPVNPLPTISCNTTSGTTTAPAGLSVTLGNGVIPYKVIVNDFGDGSKDSVVNVLGNNFNFGHSYATTGNYNISVTVYDVNGCSASSNCSVLITPDGLLPTAVFDATNRVGCGSVTVTMNNTSLNASSYAWSTSDGQVSTQTNPTFTFNTVGNHNITLIATNTTGNDTLTLINYVIVHPNVTATISANREYCLLEQVCVVDSTSGAVSWTWDMGNGSTSTAQNWCAFYNPGTYNVKLTAVGYGGCTDDTTITITVVDTPRVNFTATVPNASCAQAEVTFTNNTTGANGTNRYLWDFGDGTFSNDTLPNLTHVYNTSGNYTVTLYAESMAGCTSISFTTFPITILPVPTAIFTVDSSLIKLNPTAINTFTNTSIGADTLKWDFGNGQTLTQTFPFTNPYATYTTPGVYTVRLYAINQLGCIDSTIRTFTVDVNESIFLPNVFSPNGDLLNDAFGPNLQGFTNYSTMIYDRWGNLVVTIKENALWDGTKNGTPCPEGVYVYTFKGTLNSGKEVERVGSVTLIR